MNAGKADFLQYQLLPLLRQVPSDKSPHWGKMTLQQTIEHFSDFVKIASGKTLFTNVITPPDKLERMRDWLESDKPFRENTVNPLLPEVPAPVKNPSMESALKELQEEMEYFFSVFEKNNLQVTRNPLFGDLNYEQNIQLLYKHALHHLKQFGVMVENTGA